VRRARGVALAGLIAVASGGAGCVHDGLALRPGDPVKLRKQVAATLLAHHAWAAATEPLRDLVASRPRDPDVHAMLGTAYREQGLHDEAEHEYREAIQLDVKRDDAWNGLGVLRELRGDPGDAALDDLKKAIELRPDVAAYYNNLGFALYLRGRDIDAVEAYRKGLVRDPGANRMRNNLAFAYGRLGQWNHAKREFYRACAPAEAENNLGYVYEKAGDLAAACERYREAASLAPTLPVAQVNLTRACGALAVRRDSDHDGAPPPPTAHGGMEP
jgi:Flp pilus assembly protein TadD